MKYLNELALVLDLYKRLGLRLRFAKNQRAFGFFNLRTRSVSIDSRALKKTPACDDSVLDLIYVLLHEMGHALDFQTQRFKSFYLKRSSLNEDEMELWTKELAPAELSADYFAKSIMVKLKLPTKRCYYLWERRRRGRIGFAIMVLRSYGVFAVRVK